MNTYEIIPGKQVGEIRLGMSKAQVRAIVEDAPDNVPPHNLGGIDFPESDYFFESSIEVSYNKISGNVEWIGISNSDILKAEFGGLDVFSTEAIKLIECASQHDKIDCANSEPGTAFCFSNLGICFWRESTPEEILEEMQGEDFEEEDRDWMLEDIEKFRYFQQVSIFEDGYWEQQS